jgi:hypothetical protein
MIVPYKALITVLAAVALIVGVVAGFKAYRASVYNEGVQAERKSWQDQKLQETIDRLMAEKADLEARSKDAAERARRLTQENEDAKTAADQLLADLRRGAVRVRSKFQCPAVKESSPGELSEESSGFTQEDAAIALGIAREGDDAIRELNACVDQLHADRSP